MNPQRDYGEGETVTTRAFIHLFRELDDVFQFAIDSQVADDEEVRAHLTMQNFDFDGRTTIGVTAINEKERFETVRSKMEEMGLEILEEEVVENEHKSIGSYTAYVLTASADESVSAEWNVPHMLVYGSLSPEIEESCYAAFGHQYEYDNIRNHYVVVGDGLTEQSTVELATAIQQSNEFFDDYQRDAVSSVNTATVV